MSIIVVLNILILLLSPSSDMPFPCQVLMGVATLATCVSSAWSQALDPLDEEFNWQALEESPAIDDPAVMQEWMKEDDVLRSQNDQ